MQQIVFRTKSVTKFIHAKQANDKAKFS
uniref:Uncharacterized protein n=1 Tax=Rhizophora mucronata TaxID=61149 RepID=A0A2P2IXF7_RHIMU